MATILAHIQVRSGTEASFEITARKLATETHENETGVNRYEYWRSAKRGHYYCMLAFKDFHAFLEHQTSAHHDNTGAGFGDSIENMSLEWIDPVEGASPLPNTDMQDLPAGANEAVRAVHAGMPAEVQDWWQKLR